MKTMTDVARSVAANASTANILDGKPEVYLSKNSAVVFYISAAAAGILATILIGDSVVVDDQEVSSSNRYPIRPDDLFARSGGASGDLVYCRLRNRTAGAVVCTTVVDVQAV